MTEPATFVQFVVGFLLMETGVHASCPIELSPPSVVVRYGEPISVNCRTSQMHLKGIGWEATEGGTGLEKVNNLTWTVPALTDWNISSSCYVTPSTNSSFQQCSKETEIVLYTFPENISISINFSDDPDGVMTEMKDYGLRCEIRNVAPVGKLNISWYKGDKIIRTLKFYNETKKPKDVFSEIIVTPTRQNLGETYKCVAHLDLGLEPQLVSTKEYSLQVYYPPVHIDELEDSVVDAGSTVLLNCSSMGFPRPKYTWDYYRTFNVVEENDDGVSRLVIRNAAPNNSGFYTCQARNQRGNVSKTVKVTVNGAKRDCPVEITSENMVIQYKSRSRNATCKPTSSGSENMEGESYWVLEGTKINSTIWSVDTHKDWDQRPMCTATFKGIGTCHKPLNVTLYKMPDSVSIRSLENLMSVIEEKEFQLQCDITNVAPAQNLSVQWFRGNEAFTPKKTGQMRVTDCLPANSTDCSINAMRFPLNVTYTINITLNREHNEAEFQCMAQLDLGHEGPQPLPNKTSSPVNLNVYYKPTINTTKLPKTIPVFRGYPEELVCEADGHPAPKIQWLYSSKLVRNVSGNILIVSEAGFYNCSATNEVDSIYHDVEVILKEDYLPLLAGFVAVTVVAISIIFVFIFSIYYKNTRTRRYSLKNPKFRTHNGNVAHNGWDSQFPMTKLS